MTWEELQGFLYEKCMAKDPRMQNSVTVWDMTLGEYYPADTLEIAECDDVLDEGHLFLGIET